METRSVYRDGLSNPRSYIELVWVPAKWLSLAGLLIHRASSRLPTEVCRQFERRR